MPLVPPNRTHSQRDTPHGPMAKRHRMPHEPQLQQQNQRLLDMPRRTPAPTMRAGPQEPRRCSGLIS
jgi:hypothetical protein